MPSVGNLDSVKAEASSLLRDLAASRPSSHLGRLYLRCFTDSLEFLDACVDEDARMPDRYITGLATTVNHLVDRDSREPAALAEVLQARLAGAARLIDTVRHLTAFVDPAQLFHVKRAYETLSLMCGRARESVREGWSLLPVATLDRIDAGLQDLSRLALLARIEPSVTGPTPAAPGVHSGESSTAAPAPETYSSALRRLFGMDQAGLESWCDEEIQRCHEELLEMSELVAPGEDPPTMLFRELPACGAPEEMFPLMERFVGIARRESLKHIDLPEGEKCLVTKVPEQVRDSYPWGGYAGGCVYRRPPLGEVFLNETNYRAVTRGWLEMMAIHECYPGHHAQWANTLVSRLPETIRLGAKMTPVREGAAHRSEELLEHIFPEKAFPAFVAYRRLHCALRVKADLDLHAHGRSATRVMELYRTYLGFDEASARGQVLYQEQNPGYMACYYYGFKALRELELRSGMDRASFTRFIFNRGPISLDRLQELVLDSTAQERAEYLRGL